MNRSLARCIAIGSALGAAVPLALRLWLVFSPLEAAPNVPPASWSVLDYLPLMFWPTPLLLPVDQTGTPDLLAWGPFTAALAANAALYGLLGALVWAGLARSRIILLAPALIVAGIWSAIWATVP